MVAKTSDEINLKHEETKMSISEKQYGFVCPVWAMHFWKPAECEIILTTDGDFAVIDYSLNGVMIFLAKTSEECSDWLNGKVAGAFGGFEAPLKAKDEYASTLWKKHGFDSSPSFSQMESIAKKLLKNVETYLEGASIMLGRRVDAKEQDVFAFLMFAENADERFGLLLFQFEAERQRG